MSFNIIYSWKLESHVSAFSNFRALFKIFNPEKQERGHPVLRTIIVASSKLVIVFSLFMTQFIIYLLVVASFSVFIVTTTGVSEDWPANS